MQAIIFLYRSLLEQSFMTTKKKLKKKNKKHPWRIFGQDRLEKNSGKCLIRSGEIPGPRQTSVDKNNGSVMKSGRGALVSGSDSPSGHSAHSTAGDMGRARGQASDTKFFDRWCVENRRHKISIPPRWQKYIFLQVCEKSVGRRGPLSRPLDHGCT